MANFFKNRNLFWTVLDCFSTNCSFDCQGYFKENYGLAVTAIAFAF